MRSLTLGPNGARQSVCERLFLSLTAKRFAHKKYLIFDSLFLFFLWALNGAHQSRAALAFKQVALQRQIFCYRGNSSGTHIK